ncbi:MAG: hypothetical protein U0412_06980 [Nitrospira sp.]
MQHTLRAGTHCGMTLLLLLSLMDADATVLASADKKGAVGRAVPLKPAAGTPRSEVKPPRTKGSAQIEVPRSSAKVQPGSKPSVTRPNKARRHRKSGKVAPQAAVVLPKPDMSVHGILEQPQRYDPRLERGRSGPPNPQAGEILHEHFQELDQNRDGVIDPFERALGRLDMDRDLAIRQWE